VRNYGNFLEQLGTEFSQQTIRYGKAISEEWKERLLSHFHPKINVIVMRLLEQKQSEIEEQFSQHINEEIFYDDKSTTTATGGGGFLFVHSHITPSKEDATFVEESKKYFKIAIEQYIEVLRDIGY
jgi:hypothetical protein